ncbi:Serine/threonine-protein phosphatase 2A activator 1 [Penicillium chermesinum]|uniref:Serine/threonine-protein phosphatase 2A activator n=1 Tax=Penicillium chermesinum TaxID=63820 RepID=A0A9W9PME4_9EURO|nr:Serine/threonine-protein phosphatase 2A activator 1 [Penicillium chermesinum]KAJ5247842.1 Serine/threonine-protein phosphatase 2A activator 1 [Penicillium chermesinum]KAJ6151603.1 Serine/threonine-protein phosphatase 2A activator 1 [Penicillium chermesinum]
MNTDGRSLRILPKLNPQAPPNFITPGKKIHESHDVSTFLVSKAYMDIMTFLLQLNRSMFPSKLPNGKFQDWPLHSDAVQFSAPVRQLQGLLGRVEDIITEVPPDSGPRRFGNISFRKWHQVLTDRASELLREFLPADLLEMRSPNSEHPSAEVELKAYFLGSWGSGQRLDYGTGHELSFLAFLGAIWKLGGFPQSADGVEERAIVLGVIEPYLELVRTLIKTYTLEPAGSHGVWGLDDHSFLPYIFGSAQLSPAIHEADLTPEEGSLPGAPDPGDVVKPSCVEKERKVNLYFSAIGFIYDVKKGPFWEHSPMLYDISGIRTGWGKINKGMVKMYNAEVLSKFPVVQHLPFGALFSWDRDPNAVTPVASVHSTSGPQTRSVQPENEAPSTTVRPNTDASTRAPWASTEANPPSRARPTVALAGSRHEPPSFTSTLPNTSRLPPGPMAPTRAPQAPTMRRSPPGGDGPTKAPWAK